MFRCGGRTIAILLAIFTAWSCSGAEGSREATREFDRLWGLTVASSFMATYELRSDETGVRAEMVLALHGEALRIDLTTQTATRTLVASEDRHIVCEKRAGTLGMCAERSDGFNPGPVVTAAERRLTVHRQSERVIAGVTVTCFELGANSMRWDECIDPAGVLAFATGFSASAFANALDWSVPEATTYPVGFDFDVLELRERTIGAPPAELFQPPYPVDRYTDSLTQPCERPLPFDHYRHKSVWCAAGLVPWRLVLPIPPETHRPPELTILLLEGGSVEARYVPVPASGRPISIFAAPDDAVVERPDEPRFRTEDVVITGVRYTVSMAATEDALAHEHFDEFVRRVREGPYVPSTPRAIPE